MDQNRSLLEAELKALMEVSSDFARGLSTVAARMKVLKACLDKPCERRVSRVDRATSPIVFRMDRSTSVSPLRFKSPVKFKEESVDIHEEIITDVPEERNRCDIKQEKSTIDEKENSINHSQTMTSVERYEEFSYDATPPVGNNGVSTTVTNQVMAGPLENTSRNIRKSYYVVNPATGIAIPIDVNQIKELGLSNNPIQQITIQNNQPVEEDILYAMANEKNSSIDSCSTVATVGQEILLSADRENEPEISERIYAAYRLPPLNQIHGVKKKNSAEKREYDRIRQATYHQKKERKDKSVKRSTHKVLILRKELIKKTKVRGNRPMETS